MKKYQLKRINKIIAFGLTGLTLVGAGIGVSNSKVTSNINKSVASHTNSTHPLNLANLQQATPTATNSTITFNTNVANTGLVTDGSLGYLNNFFASILTTINTTSDNSTLVSWFCSWFGQNLGNALKTQVFSHNNGLTSLTVTPITNYSNNNTTASVYLKFTTKQAITWSFTTDSPTGSNQTQIKQNGQSYTVLSSNNTIASTSFVVDYSFNSSSSSPFIFFNTFDTSTFSLSSLFLKYSQIAVAFNNLFDTNNTLTNVEVNQFMLSLTATGVIQYSLGFSNTNSGGNDLNSTIYAANNQTITTVNTSDPNTYTSPTLKDWTIPNSMITLSASPALFLLDGAIFSSSSSSFTNINLSLNTPFFNYSFLYAHADETITDPSFCQALQNALFGSNSSLHVSSFVYNYSGSNFELESITFKNLEASYFINPFVIFSMSQLYSHPSSYGLNIANNNILTNSTGSFTIPSSMNITFTNYLSNLANSTASNYSINVTTDTNEITSSTTNSGSSQINIGSSHSPKYLNSFTIFTSQTIPSDDTSLNVWNIGFSQTVNEVTTNIANLRLQWSFVSAFISTYKGDTLQSLTFTYKRQNGYILTNVTINNNSISISNSDISNKNNKQATLFANSDWTNASSSSYVSGSNGNETLNSFTITWKDIYQNLLSYNSKESQIGQDTTLALPIQIGNETYYYEYNISLSLVGFSPSSSDDVSYTVSTLTTNPTITFTWNGSSYISNGKPFSVETSIETLDGTSVETTDYNAKITLVSSQGEIVYYNTVNLLNNSTSPKWSASNNTLTYSSNTTLNMSFNELKEYFNLSLSNTNLSTWSWIIKSWTNNFIQDVALINNYDGSSTNTFLNAFINALKTQLETGTSATSTITFSLNLGQSSFTSNYLNYILNTNNAINVVFDFTLTLSPSATINKIVSKGNNINLTKYVPTSLMLQNSYLNYTGNYYNSLWSDYKNFNLSAFIKVMNSTRTNPANLVYLDVLLTTYFKDLSTNIDNNAISSSELANAIVLNYTTVGDSITSLTLLINNQIYEISNLSWNFSDVSKAYNLNISNVSNASDWMNWINSINTTTYSDNNFPNSVFSNQANNGSSLILAPANYSFSNDIITQITQLTNNAFIYNQSQSGYLNNSSKTWFTWASFSNLITTLIVQDASLFQNISTLAIADANFAGTDPLTIINNLLTWFPALTTLTLQNCSLSGSLNLNDAINMNITSINLAYNNLTSFSFPTNMTSVDVSHNNLTSIDANFNTSTVSNRWLPSVVFNVSYNNLTSLPLITYTASSNFSVFNVANNNLSSLDLSKLLSNLNVSTYSSQYMLNINVNNNNLLNLVLASGTFNVTSASWVKETNGIWLYEVNSQNIFLKINYTNQIASGNWLFSTSSSNSTLLTPAMANTSSFTNAVGINFSEFNTDVNNSSPYWLFNNTTNSGTSGTFNSNDLPVSGYGILQNSTFNQDKTNVNSLYTALNNPSTTTSVTNAVWMLNKHNLAKAIVSLNNGSNISSITFNEFANIYGYQIPYNAASFWNYLTNKNTPISFNILVQYFNQNFNLASQTLHKYTISNVNDISNTQIKDTLINLRNSQNSGVSGINSYGSVLNNQVILYNASNPDTYYMTTSFTNFSASNLPYTKLIINNQDLNSVLSLKIYITNTVNNTTNLMNELVGNSNVNQYSINRVWSLNGTSGFYDLSSSGVITSLSNDPFDMGAYQILFHNFMTKTFSNGDTYQEIVAPNGDDNFNISDVINSLNLLGNSKDIQTFWNNFYILLQQENIIQYHQLNSLFGSYNLTTKNFTISEAFANSNLTFEPYTNTNTNDTLYQGLNASISNSIINGLSVNGANSLFYQTADWANFVNTTISFKVNKNTVTETIGQYLYNEGNWNYEMPSYNNAVFNIATAKTAYDNLLNAFSLSNNLSASAFNNAMSSNFPDLIAASYNNNLSSIYDYIDNGNYQANLFTIFRYDNGKIINQYNLFANANNWYAVNLNYINTFSNIANTNSYLFHANIYGQTYFTNSNDAFNNVNNLLYSDTDNVSLKNQTAYTWTQLEENEVYNLIPSAVYNNVDVVNSNEENDPNLQSSSWVPVQNFNTDTEQINHDIVANASGIGATVAIASIALIALSVWLIVRKFSKKEKTRAAKENQKRKELQFKQEEVILSNDDTSDTW